MLRRAQQGAPIGPGHHNRASRRARAHVLDVTRRACAPTLEERDELGKRPAERDHPHGGGGRVVVDGDAPVADRAGDSSVTPAICQAQIVRQPGCPLGAAPFEGCEVFHGLDRKLVLAGDAALTAVGCIGIEGLVAYQVPGVLVKRVCTAATRDWVSVSTMPGRATGISTEGPPHPAVSFSSPLHPGVSFFPACRLVRPVV